MPLQLSATTKELVAWEDSVIKRQRTRAPPNVNLRERALVVIFGVGLAVGVAVLGIGSIGIVRMIVD